MSAATKLVQAPNQAKVNPYAYIADKSKRSEGIRAHQLSARLVDMTHDTLPEVKWRPVEKRVDKIPGQQILEDKVLLRDWEQAVMNEFFSFVYDRRFIDQDVFRRLQAQGEIIKMAID